MAKMPNELKVALIAALVAMIVSAFSVFGTLVITNRQLDREDRRSQIAFLRDARKTTYGTAAADMRNLQLKLAGLHDALFALADANSNRSQFSTARAAFDTTFTELQQSIGQVLMMGSTKVLAELVNFTSLLNTLDAGVIGSGVQVEASKLAAARQIYTTAIDQRADELNLEINTFLTVARKDVGS